MLVCDCDPVPAEGGQHATCVLRRDGPMQFERLDSDAAGGELTPQPPLSVRWHYGHVPAVDGVEAGRKVDERLLGAPRTIGLDEMRDSRPAKVVERIRAHRSSV